MSLVFGAATSDRVNHGAAASLDPTAAWTYAWWFYFTTLTQYRTFWRKGIAGPTNRRACYIDGPSDEIAVEISRATSDSIYLTNNANLTTNKWWFIAVTFDESAGAGEAHNIYLGDLDRKSTRLNSSHGYIPY